MVFIRLCLSFNKNTKIIITQLMCCYGDEDTNTVSKELHGTSTSLIFPFVCTDKNNSILKLELFYIMIKRSNYIYVVPFVINTIIMTEVIGTKTCKLRIRLA